MLGASHPRTLRGVLPRQRAAKFPLTAGPLCKEVQHELPPQTRHGEYDECVIPPEEIREDRSRMTALVIAVVGGALLWALVGFGLFMAVFLVMLRVLDLFSGIGGFSLGLERTGGFETVAFCEIEEFPRKCAEALAGSAIYEDVRKLRGADVGHADVIVGDTHSLSPQPGDAEARKMTAISGQNLVGSWLNSGPLGSLERTLLGTSAWASTTCFLTWKDKVTPAGRLLFQLAPSVPRIEGIGVGPSDKHPLWSTPQAQDRGGRHKAGSHLALTKQVQGWNKDGTMWATPRSCSAMAAENIGNRVNDRFPNLESQVAKSMWPTPSAADNRDRGNLSSPAIARRKAKGKQIMLSQSVSPESGALNPTWVEWLMGFPTGWTDLKPSETP
jgi:hypothetical protein